MDNDAAIDAFLEHHGVKGMRWGVRKQRESGDPSDSSSKTTSNHKKLKTAGLIIGGVAAVALIAAGAYYVSKNGGLPISSLKTTDISKGKEAFEGLAKHAAEEPTSPVLATRGKYIGNGFLMKGGLSDPIHEYDKAGFNNGLVNVGTHRRYGEAAEKVAVSFLDPKGRTDHAGRIIGHEVIIPAQHAEGINTFEDASNKAWSLIKDTFDPFYQTSLDKTNRGRIS